LVRHGRVNRRYVRENFARGGIGLVQITSELVTNADSAIAVGARGLLYAGDKTLPFGDRLATATIAGLRSVSFWLAGTDRRSQAVPEPSLRGRIAPANSE
jgi:hypothetical protein